MTERVLFVTERVLFVTERVFFVICECSLDIECVLNVFLQQENTFLTEVWSARAPSQSCYVRTAREHILQQENTFLTEVWSARAPSQSCYVRTAR